MPAKVHIDFDRLPTFRIDHISGKEVLIASARRMREKKQDRVVAYTTEEMKEYVKNCPFCPGNEEQTPLDTWTIRKNLNDPSSWIVRAFPNRFPCHTIEEVKKPRKSDFFSDNEKHGTGAHEVLVESHLHNGWLSGLTAENISHALRAAVERYFSLGDDTRFNQFYLFKNYGREAAASLTHPHIQMVCTSRIQKKLQTIFLRMIEYYVKHNECLVCRLSAEEKRSKREVLSTKFFTVYVPFAAEAPYELRIVPKDHNPSFAHVLRNEEVRLDLALTLKASLKKIKFVLQNRTDEPLDLNTISDPPYNLMLHTAPYHASYQTNSYHWFIKIVPRTTKMAGYEYGTDTIINPSIPEEDAEVLREAPGEY